MAFKFSGNARVTATIILTIFLFYALELALAASGGVMGGSSFSSDSKVWYSPPYRDSRSSYDENRSAINEGNGGGSMLRFILIVGGFVAFVRFVFDPFRSDRKSILFLQVGFMDDARAIQRDLNQVASSADTSTVKGFSALLKETIFSLLQHPTHCVSGYTFAEEMRNIASLEKRFNQLSLEEREKFDAETLVNVSNIKAQRSTIPKANKLDKEYTVVTILVAAEGTHKLPPIMDIESLKEALHYLNSIRTRKIKAVQVLWTPQNENDSLSKEELLENYPLLRSIL